MAEFNDQDLMDLVYQQLKTKASLTEGDWLAMEPHLQLKELPVNTCLQAIGEPVYRHYFLISGLVRFYYLNAEGKELNKAFYTEGSIVGNLSAIIQNTHSRFAIETLEPCLVLEFPFSVLKRQLSDSQAWERLFNYGCQMMLLRNERREAELLSLSAAERFRQFVHNFPQALDRIPQYHIASYLGITPEALSRHKRQWLNDRL